MENNKDLPQNLKIDLPHHPAISLLGMFGKKKKHANLKRYMYPSADSSIISVVKMQKQPKCPWTDEWVKM